MQKTTMIKNEAALANRKWYIIDANDAVLGKLAVCAADILRGKNKPLFTPNVDCGDFLIIINSDLVKLSHNKPEKEFWYAHSGFIGGLRKRSGKEMLAKYSDELVTGAVKGMLPRNILSRKLITKLVVCKDANHKHEAQQPIMVKVK